MTAKDKLSQGLQKVFSVPVKKKISISVLVKFSKINRTTFYRNFRSIEELIKWFVLKDLTFRYEGSAKFNFEYAFTKVFNYIDEYYALFQNIFLSPYFDKISQFIISEIYTYQMSTFPNIDINSVISINEKKTYSKFYAYGIFSLFLEYILNPSFKKDRQAYISYALRIVKGYMERAIQLTLEKRYHEF